MKNYLATIQDDGSFAIEELDEGIVSMSTPSAHVIDIHSHKGLATLYLLAREELSYPAPESLLQQVVNAVIEKMS